MRFVDRMIDARLAEGTPDEMRPRDLFDLLATARDPETGGALRPRAAARRGLDHDPRRS
jgi:hypothetical protein